KIPMTRSLTSQEAAIFEAWYKKQKEAKDLQESISESTRKQTKEVEKQTKESAKQAVLLAGNNERVRNMLRVYQSFRNAGLGDKQARVMTAQVGRETDFRNEAMFGSHKDANNGYTNTGFLSWQKSRSTKLMQSLQGQGVLDKNGKIQQTQDALDAMAKHAVQEAMTDKSYSKSKAALLNDDLDYRSLERIVAKNFVGWDYDGKKLGKAKASQHLAKQDSYYNQLSKILGDNPEAASKAISDLSKFEDEAYKARAKTLEEIKQLQATYDSETVARSKKREEEINKATILGQSNLIPKINERFDAEDKLAQKQFDFEVNGYKWTEKQKLEYTYEINSLRLVAEGKLSEDQRKVALDGLELQKQQELGLLKLAQEQRLFQAEQFMLGEMERIKKRYALEYDEISKITDLEERRRKMSAFQADFIRNGVGNPTIDQYDTSSQFLKSTNYTKPKQTNMQVLDEDYAQTYQKLKDNLAAVLESEKASYQERLEAERVFKEARQQMDNEYHLKAIDARKADHDSQLQLYSQMISSASSTWGGLTQIVKDARGENSRSFKAMFIAQQSFAIASAIISAHLAATQVAADATIPFFGAKIAASTAMLAMGYANAGLIAGQTIAGFSDGGYTGSGRKYEPAGIVHKGEVVWSQEDIKRWGGVGLVEKMRKSANPEAFLNNNASADSVMRRALMSSNAFIESQKQADIFNQPVQDTQIIYKGNRDTPKLASSANSDLFHDGKVYFSSNGLVQDRSNLEDVQDFTIGKAARPQAEIMPSIEPASPTINFKIEVVNQVSGATVEAEQLDEQTVRIIVTDELDKQLPRKVPKLVSDQIANPNSTISRSLTENTTARRNR
ncbi:phage tail protein, partial [Acinetobacter baumannii]